MVVSASNPVTAPVATYKGDQSGRGLSPGLWGNVNAGMRSGDPSAGIFLMEDFLGFNGKVTSNVGHYTGQAGGYYSYEDSAQSILQLATERGGVIRLLTTTTDNLENSLQFGGATSVLGSLSDAAGARLLTIFEARIRTSVVLDSKAGLFIGLAQEGVAVNSFMADTGSVLADKDLIGFWRDEADGDQMDTVYQKTSGGVVELEADALDTALVAAAWTKLGLVYDPHHPDGARVSFFQNGLKLGTELELTAGDPDTFPATFPDGEELSPVFAIKNATNVAHSLDIDWWAFYQQSA